MRAKTKVGENTAGNQRHGVRRSEKRYGHRKEILGKRKRINSKVLQAAALRDSIETACPKCGSLMVSERFIDYQQTGESAFVGWRCLSCGLILDPLILSRRVEREGGMALNSAGAILAGVGD